MRRVRSNPVVVGETFAGIRIGQPISEARAILGIPAMETRNTGPNDGNDLLYGSDGLALRVYGTNNLGVTGIGLRDDALLLNGQSPRVGGIGIGASKDQVVAVFGTPRSTEDYDREECYFYPGLRLWFGADGVLRDIQVSKSGLEETCFG